MRIWLIIDALRQAGCCKSNLCACLGARLGCLRKPRRRRQRERHQTKGVMSRTMAVHVRYKSLYISLPSAAKQQREIIKFCLVWGTRSERRQLISCFSIWNWTLSLHFESKHVLRPIGVQNISWQVNYINLFHLSASNCQCYSDGTRKSTEPCTAWHGASEVSIWKTTGKNTPGKGKATMSRHVKWLSHAIELN